MKKKVPVLVSSLAANLRAERLAVGLTQEELAKKTGLSVAYVSLLERAGRTAPLNTVERLAKALHLPPHHLLLPAPS